MGNGEFNPITYNLSQISEIYRDSRRMEFASTQEDSRRIEFAATQTLTRLRGLKIRP